MLCECITWKSVNDTYIRGFVCSERGKEAPILQLMQFAELRIDSTGKLSALSIDNNNNEQSDNYNNTKISINNDHEKKKNTQ